MLRLWAVAVSVVVGAMAGFVGYFLYLFRPKFPSDEWSVMIGGALVGLIVALLATRRLGRRDANIDSPVDDDTPWPGTMTTADD